MEIVFFMVRSFFDTLPLLVRQRQIRWTRTSSHETVIPFPAGCEAAIGFADFDY
ncbi:MAG: hypothetical protein RBS34_15090 [Desulfofustis sp.]|jgi:hypothetical protein|nr:hypothetical protein [Desulfofustis sp.]